MPNKHNDPRRHHIPRARYRVENWPEYDRGLVQRGDIRFWISEDALVGWIAPDRTTPGGQRKFSNLAIEATLVLGAVFKLPLRQTEGFVRSLMALLKRDLPVPDHTTLARRRRTVRVDQHAPGRRAPVDLVLDSTGLKFFGAGEWARQKHGEKRRSWRKLHIPCPAGNSRSEMLRGGSTLEQERSWRMRSPRTTSLIQPWRAIWWRRLAAGSAL
ncbi:MAG: IS5 family transposase [Pseudomonadota bacterium]